MKKQSLVTVDANGNVDMAAGSGISFAVVPAGSSPGAYPVTIQRVGGRAAWMIDQVVDGPAGNYGRRDEEFDRLRIVGASPGSTYRVIVGTDPADKFDGLVLSRTGVLVKATDIQLPNVAQGAGNAPTLATQGIPLAGLDGFFFTVEAPAGKTLVAGIPQLWWWDPDVNAGAGGWEPDWDASWVVANKASRRQTFLQEKVSVPYGRAYVEMGAVTTNDNTGNLSVYYKGVIR